MEMVTFCSPGGGDDRQGRLVASHPGRLMRPPWRSELQNIVDEILAPASEVGKRLGELVTSAD